MASVFEIEKLRWGLSAKRLNEALEKVGAYVVTLRQDVDGAGEDLLEVQDTVEDIQDALATIDSTLTQINQTLADHESRISALENPG